MLSSSAVFWAQLTALFSSHIFGPFYSSLYWPIFQRAVGFTFSSFPLLWLRLSFFIAEPFSLTSFLRASRFWALLLAGIARGPTLSFACICLALISSGVVLAGIELRSRQHRSLGTSLNHFFVDQPLALEQRSDTPFHKPKERPDTSLQACSFIGSGLRHWFIFRVLVFPRNQPLPHSSIGQFCRGRWK